MQNNKVKVVKIKDGEHEKVFFINKLECLEWAAFACTMADMLISTPDMDANIVKQWLNNRFLNGENITGYDPEKVDETVQKEITSNTGDFLFNLLKSIFFKMEDNKYNIMEQLLKCISFQNGDQLLNLNLNKHSNGYASTIIEDGFNLLKLLKVAFIHNYGAYLPGLSVEETIVPKQ